MVFHGKHLLVCTLLTAAGARAADEPAFSTSDVPTVFFFSKSDDKNRVDYGLRLDSRCLPVGDEPVFPYWREFEGGANGRKTHMPKFFEYAAYGVAEQKVTKRGDGKADIALKLKALDRPMTLTTEKTPEGPCKATAHATIAGVPNAELQSAYIKLKSGWTVEYVEVRARDPKTDKGVAERLSP